MNTLIAAGVEYYVGRRLRLPDAVLARGVAARLRRGGVLTQKVGQLVASRPDIIDDPCLLAELRTLQCMQTSRGVYEASIAVVHIDERAGTATKRLRDPSVAADGAHLARWLWLATLFAHRVPQMLVLTDALRTLAQELDLAGEQAKNELFLASLRGCSVTRVPRTLTSSVDAVVMEYVPATLAKDLASAAPLALVNAFFREIVLSAISTGVLHLDLHAGNVGVSPDRTQVVVYDMGSISCVDRAVTCKACVTFAAATELVVLGDWARLAEHLVRGGILVSVRDVQNLRLMAGVAMQYAAGAATTADIGRCLRVVKGDVNVDHSVFQLMQCISILEGTCKVMNPSFNISGAFGHPAFAMRLASILERAFVA